MKPGRLTRAINPESGTIDFGTGGTGGPALCSDPQQIGGAPFFAKLPLRSEGRGRVAHLTGYYGCTGEPDVPAATVKNQMAGHPYDAAGNYRPSGYNYDAENRLISAPGSMEFDYDGSGPPSPEIQRRDGHSVLVWRGRGSVAGNQPERRTAA